MMDIVLFYRLRIYHRSVLLVLIYCLFLTHLGNSERNGRLSGKIFKRQADEDPQPSPQNAMNAHDVFKINPSGESFTQNPRKLDFANTMELQEAGMLKHHGDQTGETFDTDVNTVLDTNLTRFHSSYSSNILSVNATEFPETNIKKHHPEDLKNYPDDSFKNHSAPNMTKSLSTNSVLLLSTGTTKVSRTEFRHERNENALQTSTINSHAVNMVKSYSEDTKKFSSGNTTKLLETNGTRHQHENTGKIPDGIINPHVANTGKILDGIMNPHVANTTKSFPLNSSMLFLASTEGLLGYNKDENAGKILYKDNIYLHIEEIVENDDEYHLAKSFSSDSSMFFSANTTGLLGENRSTNVGKIPEKAIVSPHPANFTKSFSTKDRNTTELLGHKENAEVQKILFRGVLVLRPGNSTRSNASNRLPTNTTQLRHAKVGKTPFRVMIVLHPANLTKSLFPDSKLLSAHTEKQFEKHKVIASGENATKNSKIGNMSSGAANLKKSFSPKPNSANIQHANTTKILQGNLTKQKGANISQNTDSDNMLSTKSFSSNTKKLPSENTTQRRELEIMKHRHKRYAKKLEAGIETPIVENLTNSFTWKSRNLLSLNTTGIVMESVKESRDSDVRKTFDTDTVNQQSESLILSFSNSNQLLPANTTQIRKLNMTEAEIAIVRRLLDVDKINALDEILKSLSSNFTQLATTNATQLRAANASELKDANIGKYLDPDTFNALVGILKLFSLNFTQLHTENATQLQKEKVMDSQRAEMGNSLDTDTINAFVRILKLLLSNSSHLFTTNMTQLPENVTDSQNADIRKNFDTDTINALTGMLKLLLSNNTQLLPANTTHLEKGNTTEQQKKESGIMNPFTSHGRNLFSWNSRKIRSVNAADILHENVREPQDAGVGENTENGSLNSEILKLLSSNFTQSEDNSIQLQKTNAVAGIMGLLSSNSTKLQYVNLTQLGNVNVTEFQETDIRKNLDPATMNSLVGIFKLLSTNSTTPLIMNTIHLQKANITQSQDGDIIKNLNPGTMKALTGIVNSPLLLSATMTQLRKANMTELQGREIRKNLDTDKMNTVAEILKFLTSNCPQLSANLTQLRNDNTADQQDASNGMKHPLVESLFPWNFRKLLSANATEKLQEYMGDSQNADKRKTIDGGIMNSLSENFSKPISANTRKFSTAHSTELLGANMTDAQYRSIVKTHNDGIMNSLNTNMTELPSSKSGMFSAGNMTGELGANIEANTTKLHEAIKVFSPKDLERVKRSGITHGRHENHIRKARSKCKKIHQRCRFNSDCCSLVCYEKGGKVRARFCRSRK